MANKRILSGDEKPVRLYLPPDVLSELRQYAARVELPMSQAARKIIEEALTKGNKSVKGLAQKR